MATTAKREPDAVKEIVPYSWEDMREVYLPKAHGTNEAKSKYFAVNGRSFKVPLGKKVMVPYPIYERIQIYLDALDAMDEVLGEIPDNQ